jgi:NADH-quinone oxidoreductase subunit C
MEVAEIHRMLREKFGDAVFAEIRPAVWTEIRVEAGIIEELCAYLRDEPSLRFDCLSNLTAVDRKPEDRIEVVYHLLSYPHRHQIVIKVSLPRLDPVVRSLSRVWPIADWLEREAFDLMGVDFPGHPDLRRILMPEDWVGHPLRKDFVEPDEYHGISTRRESLLKL